MVVGEEHVLVKRAPTTQKQKKKRRHPAATREEVGKDDSNEEVLLPDIDMDCRHRLSYMERLFNNILQNNRGLTLSHRVAER